MTSVDAQERLEILRAEARYCRERHELYRAKSYGMRTTSAARMRELETARHLAEERVATAERQLVAASRDADVGAPDG